MSAEAYRREIIGGDLAEYIVSRKDFPLIIRENPQLTMGRTTEYSKARKLLQETTSEESSDNIYWPTPNPYLDTLIKTAGDLPMVNSFDLSTMGGA